MNPKPPCDEYVFSIGRDQIPDHLPHVTSVHIASELNGWAGTIAAGGWPLEFTDSEDRWILLRRLPVGAHAYKIVINENHWMTDPQQMNQVADGYGGYNSVAEVQCVDDRSDRPALTMHEAEIVVKSLIDNLPTIPRPRHFPYQNHNQSMTWTAEHIAVLLTGSKTLLSHLESALPHWVPCLQGQALSSDFDQSLSSLPESCLQSTFGKLMTILWRMEVDQESIQRLVDMSQELSPSIAMRTLLLSFMHYIGRS